MTNVLFAGLTWPWVLLPLAGGLVGVWWPNRQRVPADCGRGTAVVACLFLSSAWGAAIYENAWAFLLLPEFIIAAATAAVIAFVLGSWVGKALQKFWGLQPEEVDKPAPENGHFLSAILVGLIAVVGALPAALASDAPGAYAIARYGAWLVIPFALFLTWSYARLPTALTWKTQISGYVVFAALFTLLAAAHPWREAIALDDAIRSAVPGGFSQVGDLEVNPLIADDCERDASGTWEYQSSFNDTVALVEGHLRDHGWSGAWKTRDPSIPYVVQGSFSRNAHVDRLTVAVSDRASMERMIEVHETEGGFADVSAQFDPTRVSTISVRLEVSADHGPDCGGY